MGKNNNFPQTIEGGVSDDLGDSISRCSSDSETDLAACRVCHCVESDKRGDIVLGFLGIIPPFRDEPRKSKDLSPNCKQVSDVDSGNTFHENGGKKSAFVEFVSPTGEIFICNTDLEMGFTCHQDSLIELGCSCKSDLALVHYSCALKWFVNHGSTICEICGCVAKNIKTEDFKKVVAALKDYEVLRERTVNGVPNPVATQTNFGVDPDAVAAIRRQRLSEISLWFNPYNHNNTVTTASVVGLEQPPNIVAEGFIATENPATKWAVEGTGILLATGLLTVTLAWLIAPRVGKKTARSGLHILLGGICALTVVVFFRFVSPYIFHYRGNLHVLFLAFSKPKKVFRDANFTCIFSVLYVTIWFVIFDAMLLLSTIGVLETLEVLKH